MKMRRSLWRKLLVLVFAILTAVSIYMTVRYYMPTTVNSGLALDGKVTVTTVENADEEFPYLCTITAKVNNVSSATQRPAWLVVSASTGYSQEVREIPFPVTSIPAGGTCNVTETFPTTQPFKGAASVSVTMRNMKNYTLLGSGAARKIPAYIKALAAISAILFGVFIYTIVALIMSPKKKVHSRHHHHHHHHHSSEHSETSGN